MPAFLLAIVPLRWIWRQPSVARTRMTSGSAAKKGRANEMGSAERDHRPSHDGAVVRPCLGTVPDRRLEELRRAVRGGRDVRRGARKCRVQGVAKDKLRQ